MFDRQPILIGELLQLRPLVTDDHESLYRAAADPLIWAQHPDPSRAHPAGFKVFFDKALASGGALVAIDRATQQVIGTSRFHSGTSDQVTIGFTFLARAYWGGRFNGEMKRLMIDHAFRFVPAVVFRIGENNLRSRRAVEKLGGIFEGFEPKPEYGQLHAIYRLSRTSWQDGRCEGEPLCSIPTRSGPS
jgi:RimJ/RimL family protein N-acetyltransferase